MKKSKCPACSFDGKSLNTLRSKAKKPKQKQQEESKQDKLSQCEIFFDGKTLNTFTDSILIYPTRQSNQSSVNSENHLIDVRANESSVVDLRSESNHAYITNDLNRFYQDMSIFSGNL